MFLGLPKHRHFVGMFLGVPMHRHFFKSGYDDMPHRGRHRRSSKWDWKDEQRTPRGEIKYILLSLLAEQPRHGYDLIKELEARYGGFWKPSPGSVYPTLQLLEEGGYLTSEQVEGKKVYTITESGRQLLAERGDPQDWMTKRNKPQQWLELGNAIADLGGVVMQVARSGNTDHINRVREILNRAKREIYSILAEE